MQRRDFLKVGMASTAAGVIGGQILGSSVAFAGEKKSATQPESAPALETALAHCLQTGYACVAHCMSELATGNKEMADCNKKVHDMLAACDAMLKLSSYKSSLAKSMAKVCAQACDDCAEACHKHSAHWGHGMHLACKACYDACLECAKLCKA